MHDDTMTDQEKQEWDLRMRKLDVEIAKLHAETIKLTKESRWYEAFVIAAVIGATAAIVKLFF